MFPAFIRTYLVRSLSGTPDVLERLLKDLSADDPRWDFRPDPDRFTLREIVAHLADWEPIHLERLTRLRDEDNPTLPDRDENQMAIDNDYAHSDPHGSLEWFRGGRLKIVQLLASFPQETWERIGSRVTIGPVSVDILSAFILVHDGYHTQQISQWLNRAEEEK
jgi:hypothetical protein